MIPLRDDQPTSTFPLITVLLIALNVAVYLAQITIPGFTNSNEMVPYEITHHRDLIGVLHLAMPTDATGMTQRPIALHYGPSPHPLWLTVFTAMFMHAGLLHIGGNMLFLWIFGNNIEDALGKVRFLVFYLTCGVAAASLEILTAPDSPIPRLGASGAIAGVLGAYLILYPNARVLTLVPIFVYFLAEIRAQWVLLAWVVYDILPGFLGGNAQRGAGAWPTSPTSAASRRASCSSCCWAGGTWSRSSSGGPSTPRPGVGPDGGALTERGGGLIISEGGEKP